MSIISNISFTRKNEAELTLFSTTTGSSLSVWRYGNGVVDIDLTKADSSYMPLDEASAKILADFLTGPIDDEPKPTWGDGSILVDRERPNLRFIRVDGEWRIFGPNASRGWRRTDSWADSMLAGGNYRTVFEVRA